LTIFIMADREASGLLMKVIRTLHETDTGQEREEQKKELERDFRSCDAQLDKLVARNQGDLSSVMLTYSTLSSRLHRSRSKLSTVRESLVACKELLHYKRDELKKLWLDGVEQKHILQMLKQIQEMKDLPEKINSQMAKKEFLEATRSLTLSLSLLKGTLKDVEALNEVKAELEIRKTHLYNRLLEDLTSQIYEESTWDVLQLQRVGSTRDRENPFQRADSGRNSSEKNPLNKKKDGSGKGSGRKTGEQIKARRLLLETANNAGALLTPAEEDDWNKILEDPESADQSLGPAHCILINMECLAMLNKMPDTVETLNGELQKQLFQILTRTSQQLSESGRYPQGDKRLLPQLFSAVVSQLQRVVEAHRLATVAGNRSVTRHKTDHARLDLAEVWSKVQSVIQVLLTDYLDFKTSSSTLMSLSSLPQQNSNNFTEPTADINSYFVRRKTARPKKTSLFRFDSSSTALSMNDYLREHVENEKEGKEEKILVCPADPHNITLIFNQLMQFIQEIEKALKVQPGAHCTLYAFLMDYIKDVFLGQIHVDISNSLNSASQSLDAWKSVSDSDVLRDMAVTRPLLQSTVNVWKSISDLGEMMTTLPLYSHHFLTIMCNILMQYKEICGAAYRGLVQPDAEDKRIISAQWAKDEDISRFLKSLPNWVAINRDLQQEETAEEIDVRNTKETDMLVQNLGSSEIPSHEILSDPGQLRSLAQLHQSLDWFAQSVLKFARGLPTGSSNLSTGSKISVVPPLPETTINTLISLAKEFEELGDVCLLVLHLEVRVHCFYYLMPLWRGGLGPTQFSGGLDSTDPSQEIIQLNKDLLAVEDALDACLQPHKIQYVFEGVSHLVSAILIMSAASIKKINSNGVKKMCRNIFAIQHTLTASITGRRELALDQAKTFYELFNMSPKELLASIVERGAVFRELDYMNVLQLMHRSAPHHDAALLTQNMDKLSQILRGQGARPGVAV